VNFGFVNRVGLLQIAGPLQILLAICLGICSCEYNCQEYSNVEVRKFYMRGNQVTNEFMPTMYY